MLFTRRREELRDLETISADVVDVALRLHRDLGPGLLINFGGATVKEALRRIVSGYASFASSRLRVSQTER
jgi:hypothetical protein